MEPQARGLTAQLAQFVAGSQQLALDQAVQRTVRTGFTDTVGVMLAGRNEPVTQAMLAFVAGRKSSLHESSVLLGSQRAGASDAALVNATAGHALDYDDVGLMGHPSVVLVPALLAEGEHLHAGGEALMRAYVAGYETWAELIRRDEDLHHLKGWHPTAVFGVVAVAAAVASLRGLPAAACGHALGLAASMAGGLIANFGSMAKPFHAGRAAAGGIDAVNLAAAGVSAAPDAIEHPAGFLAALSPKGRVDRGPAPAAFGTELRIATLGLTVKKYPMCFAAHRSIDAALDLVRKHGLAASDIKAVHATVGVAQAAMLRNHAPRNALEAKFSLEFAVAAAVLARKVGFAELDDAFVKRPQVQQFFSRVRIASTDTICAHEPALAASDRLVIETGDGSRFDSGEVAGTRGDAATPLADEEIESKFMDCCARAGHADASALFNVLRTLEDVVDAASLPQTPKELR